VTVKFSTQLPNLPVSLSYIKIIFSPVHNPDEPIKVDEEDAQSCIERAKEMFNVISRFLKKKGKVMGDGEG
jgi:hypothetical protein